MTTPHLGNKIIILSNQVKHCLHQASEVEGISGAQGRILHILSVQPDNEPLYQKDLEEIFHLSRSTVAQTIQTMEKNGLLTRSSVSQDARLKKLEITDKGREINARIGSHVIAMEQELSRSLTEEEIQTFLRVMDKLGERMKQNLMWKGENT